MTTMSTQPIALRVTSQGTPAPMTSTVVDQLPGDFSQFATPSGRAPSSAEIKKKRKCSS